MFERVDPFIGTEATSLPPQTASRRRGGGRSRRSATRTRAPRTRSAWSARARTAGAYPTGYGRYDLGTEGLPTELYDRQVASGFTHFQQSGTGAIRKYYNYFRVTPMLQPLDDLGQLWDIVDESAEPGYYAATLGVGHPRGDHGRPEVALSTGTRSPRTGTRGWSSTSRWAGCPSRTAGRCRCGRTCTRSARGSRRARSSSRALRWRSTWSATTRAGGRCSGTTVGSCRAARGWTSTGSGRRRCGRSG